MLTLTRFGGGVSICWFGVVFSSKTIQLKSLKVRLAYTRTIKETKAHLTNLKHPKIVSIHFT